MQPKEECKMEIRKTKTKPFFIGVEETKEKKKTFLLPFTKVYYLLYFRSKYTVPYFLTENSIDVYIDDTALFL